MSQQFRIPVEKPEPKDPLRRFNELNQFVTEQHGAITSLPGSADVTVECLPGSLLPEQLCDMGYKVTYIGKVERILASAIEQHFAIGPEGDVELLTTGSTKAVGRTVRHAGIVSMLQFSLRL